MMSKKWIVFWLFVDLVFAAINFAFFYYNLSILSLVAGAICTAAATLMFVRATE